MEESPTLTERAIQFFLRILANNWVPLSTLGVIVAITAISVEDAHWTPMANILGPAIIWGAILGGLLALSRFRGWFSWLYLLVMALAFLAQSLNRIVPPLNDLKGMLFLDILDMLNTRLGTLFARVGGWISAYQQSEKIQDTGLFVLLFGLLGWFAAAWLVWSAVRRRRALDGLLPIGILVAVNIRMSGQNSATFWFFLACAMVLVTRTTFTRLHKGWDKAEVDYPDEMGIEWGPIVAAVLICVLFLVRVSPLVGTPTGWKTLSDLFRPAQQQLADTAGQIFAGVKPPDVGDKRPSIDTPNLSSIGETPATGIELVMWVGIDDPPPPPPQAMDEYRGPESAPQRQHYWRNAIFTRYTGSGWETAQTQSLAPQLAGDPLPAPPSGRYALSQTFTIQAIHGADLFATNQPIRSGAGTNLVAVGPDQSILVQGNTGSYSVVSWSNDINANQLAEASGEIPAEIRRDYLQLPGVLPQRVRDLAARVAEGGRNNYEKTMRIQNYLRITYPYKLDTPPPPPNQDVADYFLFEAPGGFCTYYATAMTVMLRSQGIPARVVSGYAMGSYDYDRGAYRVAVGDSHAWVEVYFPQYGWIEFEPTAIQNTFHYPDVVGSTEIGPVPLPERVIALPLAWQIALLWFGLMALTAGLGYGLIRFARRPRSEPQPEALAQMLYLRMRLHLGWGGIRAVPGATPSEFLSVSLTALTGQAELVSAVKGITGLYEQAAYSPHPPTLSEIQTARRLWRRSLPQRLSLWFQRVRKGRQSN